MQSYLVTTCMVSAALSKFRIEYLILPSLHNLDIPNVFLCRDGASTRAIDVRHIRQLNKWSCGYRNLQMWRAIGHTKWRSSPWASDGRQSALESNLTHKPFPGYCCLGQATTASAIQKAI